ncbi:MAG: Yip1 family protein [Gemmatimonadales bacterium]
MNLVERAKRLLLTPKPEWQVIDAEPTTTAELYTKYIIPLAAIGPIARVIGFSLIGMHVPFSGVTYRTPIGRALVGAVVSYVLALVGVYVLAMIIDMLAPSFGGTTNRMQALKVAAYSSTAAWLAAIFAIVPGLSILGILGLYSIYLLYVGLPILMKSPADKAGAYTVVVILVAIVLFFLIGVVGSRVMMGGMY